MGLIRRDYVSDNVILVLFGDDKYGELQSILFVSLIERHYSLMLMLLLFCGLEECGMLTYESLHEIR